MLWVYVLLATVGVVAMVPTVLRAVEGRATDMAMGFVGSVGLFGGAAGLVARQATSSALGAFISAVAIGLAAFALHPELLASLQKQKNLEPTHDER